MRQFTIIAVIAVLSGCSTPTRQAEPPVDPTLPCLISLGTDSRFASVIHKINLNDAAPGAEQVAHSRQPTPDEAEIIRRYVAAGDSCYERGEDIRRQQMTPEAFQAFKSGQKALQLELSKLAAGQSTYAQSAESRRQIGLDTIQKVTALQQRGR